MTIKLPAALAAGAAAAALFAGCGGSGSGNVAAPAPQRLGAAGQTTYPIGALGGKTRAQVMLDAVRRLPRGRMSSEAVAAKALVYVADLGDMSIHIFHQQGKNQQPIGTITDDLAFPAGMTVDTKGNLYVADESQVGSQWMVPVFAPGQTSPSKTYTTDLSSPTDVAVAKDGTVYISNFNELHDGWVAVYPRGKTAHEYRLSDFSGGSPLTLALDAHGNLYVLYDINSQGSSAVNEYAPGAKTGTNLNLTFSFGGGIQVDKSGNVLVAQQLGPPAILVFPPGKTLPSKTIYERNDDQPFSMAINQGSRALFAVDVVANTANRFAYPSGRLQYVAATLAGEPSGIAVTPSEFKR